MMPTAPPSADKLAELFPQPIVGNAYGPALRLGALTLVLFTVLFAVGGWFQGIGPTSPAGALIGAVAIGMIASGWYIVMGKTTIDANGVSQEWIMPKTYKWEDIFRARLVKLPMNTRLLLNVGRPPFKTIHAGTPELRDAFERIAQTYNQAANRQ